MIRVNEGNVDHVVVKTMKSGRRCEVIEKGRVTSSERLTSEREEISRGLRRDDTQRIENNEEVEEFVNDHFIKLPLTSAAILYWFYYREIVLFLSLVFSSFFFISRKKKKALFIFYRFPSRAIQGFKPNPIPIVR